MPPSGAAFFLLAFSVFILFLISAEERFLTASWAMSTRNTVAVFPAYGLVLAPAMPPHPARPHWLQAFVAETYPIAFTLCFAIFAWRYNARILIQCLLICYGLSLVVRALTKRPAAACEPLNSGSLFLGNQDSKRRDLLAGINDVGERLVVSHPCGKSSRMGSRVSAHYSDRG